MDEVVRIKTELEKAFSAKDGDKAAELLKMLVNLPVTMLVLQDTHIGATVNKIRKSFDHSESRALATKVVKKWKKMAELYKQGGGQQQQADMSANSNSSSVAGVNQSGATNIVHSQHNNGNNQSISGTATEQNNGNHNRNSSATADLNGAHGQDSKLRQSSSAHQSDGKTSTPTTPRSDQQTGEQKTQPRPSTSNTNESGDRSAVPESKLRFIPREVTQTNSTARLKFRQMICDALRKPFPKELMNQDPFLDEESLAARIEEHIFQEFKSDTDPKYRNRVRSRICNLNDNKNPYLRLNVLRGDISAEKMACMTAEEMASDELKRQREQFTKEAINDHQMAVTTGTRSSEIKCPACKKYDCTYNQMQTRSADEPMTTFCHCNNCGKRWKFC